MTFQPEADLQERGDDWYSGQSSGTRATARRPVAEAGNPKDEATVSSENALTCGLPEKSNKGSLDALQQRVVCSLKLTNERVDLS